MMTLEEVLKALDLMPFEEYRRCPKRLEWIAEMQKHHPDESLFDRATGTTTKMICKLLVHMSTMPEGGQVYIRGHCQSYTRMLLSQAREYADRLGLDPMSIHPFYGDIDFADRQRLNLFTDHYHYWRFR